MRPFEYTTYATYTSFEKFIKEGQESSFHMSLDAQMRPSLVFMFGEDSTQGSTQRLENLIQGSQEPGKETPEEPKQVIYDSASSWEKETSASLPRILYCYGTSPEITGSSFIGLGYFSEARRETLKFIRGDKASTGQRLQGIAGKLKNGNYDLYIVEGDAHDVEYLVRQIAKNVPLKSKVRPFVAIVERGKDCGKLYEDLCRKPEYHPVNPLRATRYGDTIDVGLSGPGRAGKKR